MLVEEKIVSIPTGSIKIGKLPSIWTYTPVSIPTGSIKISLSKQ